MIKLTKQRNGNIILDINNTSLNLNFNNDKIWLTKKEISNIFGVKKTEVKNILLQIKSNSLSNFNENSKRIINISTKKEKTYYSIDIIISLGYRLNNFTATRLLIKINRTLKNIGINRTSILNKLRDGLEKFSIESFFAKKYILNLNK
ncbi:MAG: hypothetical protein QM490_02740 [Candidatus Gracilibacteria bacterium]